MSLSETTRSDIFASAQATRRAQPEYVPDEAVVEALLSAWMPIIDGHVNEAATLIRVALHELALDQASS